PSGWPITPSSRPAPTELPDSLAKGSASVSVVCEALEARCHPAGWAPTSISGWAFGANVHDGSAPFVDSGYFQMHMSGSTYHLVGGPGIANSSGAYTYTRIGDNSASL